jgi:hypothetical protein
MHEADLAVIGLVHRLGILWRKTKECMGIENC